MNIFFKRLALLNDSLYDERILADAEAKEMRQGPASENKLLKRPDKSQGSHDIQPLKPDRGSRKPRQYPPQCRPVTAKQ